MNSLTFKYIYVLVLQIETTHCLLSNSAVSPILANSFNMAYSFYKMLLSFSSLESTIIYGLTLFGKFNADVVYLIFLIQLNKKSIYWTASLFWCSDLKQGYSAIQIDFDLFTNYGSFWYSSSVRNGIIGCNSLRPVCKQ